MSTDTYEFAVVVLYDREIQDLFQIGSAENYYLCMVPTHAAAGDVAKARRHAVNEVVAAFRADAVEQELADDEDAAEDLICEECFHAVAVVPATTYPCFLG